MKVIYIFVQEGKYGQLEMAFKEYSKIEETNSVDDSKL